MFKLISSLLEFIKESCNKIAEKLVGNPTFDEAQLVKKSNEIIDKTLNLISKFTLAF